MLGHPVREYCANLGGKASAPALIHQADFAVKDKELVTLMQIAGKS